MTGRTMAFPDGQGGYEAVEAKRAQFVAALIVSRFLWLAIGLVIGVSLGVLFA